MALQAGWHREWAVNFAEWLHAQGGDASGVNLSWPVVPVAAPDEELEPQVVRPTEVEAVVVGADAGIDRPG